MTATEPTQLRIGDMLAAAIEWTPGLKRIPWQRGIDLPRTVRPGYAARVHRGGPEHTVICPEADDQLTAAVILRDLEREAFRRAWREVLEHFRRALATAGRPARDYGRFPHVEGPGHLYYLPAEVDGVPVRIVLGWSMQHCGWWLTIDTALMPEGWTPE